MTITIIGYRGTGKTTVGAQLADRLGWDYVDTDPEIERRAGESIAAIFAKHGEAHFRDLESQELARQLSGEKKVVSAGGGAILREENRQLMRGAGPVVWLAADVQTLADRISNDPTTQSRRPALTQADPVSEILQVLTQRLPLYEQAATIRVETDHRSPEEIVDEIMGELKHR